MFQKYKKRGRETAKEGPPAKRRKTEEGGEEKEQPIHGNYKSYYDKRKTTEEVDTRVKLLSPEWFEGKTVLDIGCNSGKVTLEIAQVFGLKSIVGVDIDKELIDKARKYTRKHVEAHVAAYGQSTASGAEPDPSVVPPERYFPLSCPVVHGPLAPAPAEPDSKSNFPFNVSFICQDFTQKSPENPLPARQFEVITCFSVTKWIHLNQGDDGLKAFFHRIYETLHDGGVFVLEPQPWKSYKKKHNICTTHRDNYHNAKFKPEDFVPFLIEEVGFDKSYVSIPVQDSGSKGFDRELYVFTKSGKQVLS